MEDGVKTNGTPVPRNSPGILQLIDQLKDNVDKLILGYIIYLLQNQVFHNNFFLLMI